MINFIYKPPGRFFPARIDYCVSAVFEDDYDEDNNQEQDIDDQNRKS